VRAAGPGAGGGDEELVFPGDTVPVWKGEIVLETGGSDGCTALWLGPSELLPEDGLKGIILCSVYFITIQDTSHRLSGVKLNLSTPHWAPPNLVMLCVF
jgi:hypothetical protein